MFKSLAILAASGAMLVALAAPSVADFSPGYCSISDDGTSILVRATGDGQKAFQCQAECKARVARQQAFEVLRCSYRLSANAEEKAVCEHKAKSGGKVSEIAGGNIVCVPR